MAGRTQSGGKYCTCGEPDCITEPGECGANTNGAVGQPELNKPKDTAPSSSGDGGAVLLGGLLLMAVIRFFLR